MKKRIIPAILLKGGTNVSISQNFVPWRTIGALAQQLRLHVGRDCDELLMINKDLAGSCDFHLNKRLLALIRREVDIPIGYSGGIATANHAASCINSGFDKIYITSAFIDNNECIKPITSVIGSQSTGICLPYKVALETGEAYIYDFRYSLIRKDLKLFNLVKSAIDSGAGEIILFNVDRDGQLMGLDLQILAKIKKIKINIPILMAGGAGKPEHFSEALSHETVQGVVSSSIFALTENTPITIRKYCEEKGISMRRP